MLKNQIPNEKVSGYGYVWVIEKLDIEICLGFGIWFLEFHVTQSSNINLILPLKCTNSLLSKETC